MKRLAVLLVLGCFALVPGLQAQEPDESEATEENTKRNERTEAARKRIRAALGYVTDRP